MRGAGGVVRPRRAFSWKLERQRVCVVRGLGGLLARVCVDTSSPTSGGVATPYLLSGPLLISPNSSSHLWGFIAPSTEYNQPRWDESRATHATKQPPTMALVTPQLRVESGGGMGASS